MKYEYIVVENFKPTFSEPSKFDLRVRPAYDQGDFKVGMRVECPAEMRNAKVYPPGTRFRIKAKISMKHGTKYIYTNYNWEYEVLERP